MKLPNSILYLSLSLLLGLSTNLYAAEKIQAVNIVGNKKIEKEAILEKIQSKSGTELDERKVAADIRAIQKMGYFNGIDANFQNGTLSFTVKERPAIYRIVFFGNEEISTDDLKNVLAIKTYDIFDENLARESVRKLSKHYEDKGFYLAKVTYSTRPAKDGEMVEVLFRVREYDKVKIRKVTFLGNQAFSDDQLKRILRNTSEGGFFSWATGSGNFKELDFKTDLQYLQYWYLNEGYVKFRYEPPIVTVSEDKKWVFITIKVDEGPQYKMGEIDFGGDLLFPKEELHDALTLKTGEVFSISKRNADIISLTEKYQDLGYANVNVVPDIQLDDKKLLVTTNYEFEKGSLVNFGRITIKGNSKTRDKVIRRELKIREGELYSGSGMRISKENVERLGFFEPESVEFQTKSPMGRPDLLDVIINVKERPTGQFQLGAGYATTTKFFFTAQVSESNFMGRGQDLRFQTQISADKKNRAYSTSFTDPYAFDTLWSMGGSFTHSKTDYPGRYVEFRRGFGINLGHPIGDYSRLWVGYQLESLRLPDLEDPYVRSRKSFEEGTKSAITVTAAEDKRNNRMETTDGHYLALSEEFAGLGGNRKFLRTVLDMRFYRKIWGDLTFRTKLEGGTLWDYKKVDVQSAERFYLGGPNNLRGYSSFSVGPTTIFQGSSILTGGLHQFFYMAELEYPLVKDVGLKFVLFYDLGDAFNKFNRVKVRQDWGWGFRWFSPLGPLRFEWGYPIGREEDKSKGSQFQFMIGPPF
ncbi:MAG: outer membrane protein assembly factor BamA [Oligoflexia bacterium]|nr:outer membrane protein assembly factor BamA [Oligoflexia bacterium]